MTLLIIAAVALSSLVTILLLSLSFKFATADKHAFRSNQKASKGFMNALKGTVPSYHHGGMRDYKVHAGLAIDRKKNKLVSLGGLSSEAVASVLK